MPSSSWHGTLANDSYTFLLSFSSFDFQATMHVLFLPNVFVDALFIFPFFW
jgi:hypothetical protein